MSKTHLSKASSGRYKVQIRTLQHKIDVCFIRARSQVHSGGDVT